MQPLSIYPDQLTAMSETELAALSAEQLCEVNVNLAKLDEWVKAQKARTHGELQRRYRLADRAARIEAGKDFGVIRFHDGLVEVMVDTPKRVSWDQKQLADMARRIAASGDRVEEYLDIEFSIPEARYTNWPSALREQFAQARTVKPGKCVFELTVKDDPRVLP